MTRREYCHGTISCTTFENYPQLSNTPEAKFSEKLFHHAVSLSELSTGQSIGLGGL